MTPPIAAEISFPHQYNNVCISRCMQYSNLHYSTYNNLHTISQAHNIYISIRIQKFKIDFLKPSARPQPAKGRLWAVDWFTDIVFIKLCVCTYLSTYVCPYAPMWAKLLVQQWKQLLYKRKCEIKSVLNFGIDKFCTEVVSFLWFEILVW